MDDEEYNKQRKKIQDFRNSPKRKELLEFIKRHRRSHRIANSLFKARVYSQLFFTQYGWDRLKDPEFRRTLFRREGRTNLLERSILQHELYVPSEHEGLLKRLRSPPGRYASFDFYRKQEFGPRATQEKIGRLIGFPLSDLEERLPHEFTPTDYFRAFDIEHIFDLVIPNSADELIQYGLLEKTTYSAAYDAVKLYDQYERALHVLDIAEKPLYQVTPKGNGLVGLAHDFGPKKRLEKKEPKPVFA